jgi:D-alanyl-D-alanine carboxypeptidase/D-alanyl-D-alanine-endopeptidase (penicillin-binding protein 4)
VVKALQNEGLPANSVSVFVQRVDATQPLISFQADKPLNPASTMKLVTTYAGLELLGPAYRWKTEVYADGSLVSGVLHGNLVLKGYGDPSFMAEDLWRLLNSLRQSGLKDIQGNLLLDNSYFAANNTDAGAFDNEPYRAYNALPSATMVNLKSTSFHFLLQNQSANQQVEIRAEPDLPEIRIINQLKLTQGECGDWKNRLSYQVKAEGNNTTVIFTGSYAASCEEKYLELSLFEDSAYTFNLFRKIWQQLGGSIQGGVAQAVTPSTAFKIMEQTGLPMADVVRRINKYSNNLMARQLLLSIAAERVAPPATEANGDKAIRSWLADKGQSFPELVIENGAGLSRVARVSTQHLGLLLLDAYASPVMPELMSSLPILSVDGTTSRRLKDTAMQGRAHLKTGSLDAVRSVAGYVLDQKGRRWVVVFMSNHPNAGASRAAQDALLEWVYTQP